MGGQKSCRYVATAHRPVHISSARLQDVCYSWWVISALSILRRVHWINNDALKQYILRCQDVDDGGIADRPGDMPDVFHTFFGLAGLSLLVRSAQ